MRQREFEELLTTVSERLTRDVTINVAYRASAAFEDRARRVMGELLRERGHVDEVDYDPAKQAFPDIVLGEFGIEVKVTQSDHWRTVANSINEGTRNLAVSHIYLLYGKMGGVPEVRWGRYEECVTHVRTSHALRFEVEIGCERSLFDRFGVSYNDFRALPLEGKMGHIRRYVRERLKDGERLWWLGDEHPEHSTEPQVRLWMSLETAEKLKYRAEAALLCPSVVKPSRAKKKYDDAALFLLTYRGILALQARDLFSAGSVAMRDDARRGGRYIERALRSIERQMREAADYLEDDLFKEYWGETPAKNDRIRRWLEKADELATDWVPSATLFRTPRVMGVVRRGK